MRSVRALLTLGLLLAVGCGTTGRPPEPVELPEPRPEPRPRPPRSRARIEAQPFPEALPVPVDGVRIAMLAGSFDAPRSGGRQHRAIDIFAPRGTPVRSTTLGWVTRRGVRRLGGRTISVVGPGGHEHYYAHLDAWGDFRVGDFVAAGEIIGYVGNSGNARGGPTHLHYAILGPAGGSLDPYPLLRAGPGPFR